MMGVKRRILDKQMVLAAAARIANNAGHIEAVTLKVLAAELDVRSPSLYNHVDGLDGLKRDLIVWSLQQLLAAMHQALSGKVGREALAAMAQAYRAFAQTHPGIYPLLLKAPDPNDDQIMALSEEMINILRLSLASYGLQGDDTLHAIRGFRSVLHGFVSLEAAGGFELPLDRSESFNRLLEIYLDGLQANT